MPKDSSVSPPAARRVRSRPSIDFSMTGLFYCCMMMFMGLAAINTQANLLFGVFGLMIGILLVSGILSRIVLRKVRVERELPEHGVVGDLMTIFYKVTNNKRFWPSLSLCIAELDGVDGFVSQPHAYMLHAAPRMSATVPVELAPLRRGVHELNKFQISTSFPFGFINRAVIDRRHDVFCVFPAIAEVDPRVLAMCRSADTLGESSRPRPGGVDEFYGVREFRPGDNPRHIYWRRSARTGVLVSKDMTRVSPPRLLIAVDTHIPDPTPADRALLERTIAMAASLASATLAQELAVGLCAWADKAVLLAPTRGKQQREEILTLLARLPANPGFDIAQLLDSARRLTSSGATIVIFSPRSMEIPRALEARGSVVILSAASPQTREWFRFRPEVSFEAAVATNVPQ